MPKTKVFIMINSMGVGGAEKSLSSLLNLFDYDAYDVYLQLINRGGVFEKLLPPQVNILPSIPYYAFCQKPTSKQLSSGNFKFLKARLKVRKQLEENQKAGSPLHATQAFWAGAKDAFEMLPGEYDIAIAWGQGTPTHFVAEYVNARKKLAWINVNYEGAGHNKNFDRTIYGKYQNIVCVSEKLTGIFKSVFPEYSDRITTVYDINSPGLIARMAEEPVDLPEHNGILITTAGRLVQQKGYDIAIQAADILNKKGVKFKWLACGEGVERLALEEMINHYNLTDRFILLGALPNPYPYMKAADIYVQCSRFEGYCLTLTEARILNRPCVTTRFDVVYDQMVDGENGLVVDMTPEAVADGIIRLLEDEELYEHIRQYQMTEKNGNEDEIEKVYKLLLRIP